MRRRAAVESVAHFYWNRKYRESRTAWQWCLAARRSQELVFSEEKSLKMSERDGMHSSNYDGALQCV
jgi:hypothetical protein